MYVIFHSCPILPILSLLLMLLLFVVSEMAMAVGLSERSKSVEGVTQWPYRAVAKAMEVIPRTLIQNCGGNAIRLLTQLRVCFEGRRE